MFCQSLLYNETSSNCVDKYVRELTDRAAHNAVIKELYTYTSALCLFFFFSISLEKSHYKIYKYDFGESRHLIASLNRPTNSRP